MSNPRNFLSPIEIPAFTEICWNIFHAVILSFQPFGRHVVNVAINMLESVGVNSKATDGVMVQIITYKALRQ
jgi:uncharacterized membrane protein YccF (DUF307 family)